MSPRWLAWQRLRADRAAMASAAVLLVIVVAALAAPLLARWDPNAMPDPVGLQYAVPSAAHWLGTDIYSRDLWARLLFGARVSLVVGVGAALLAVLLGGAVGVTAALGGPLLDGLLMRGVDVGLALPRVFLLLAVFALWDGVPLWGVVALIAGTSWLDTSRLVRAHALALREADFVVAARALGGGWRTRLRHVLPHVGATIVVAATLDIGSIILLEAGLSYLGLGLRPPTPTWGNMILDGRTALFDAPWVALAPGLALVVTVAAFNVLGDGLRDALNPRVR